MLFSRDWGRTKTLNCDKNRPESSQNTPDWYYWMLFTASLSIAYNYSCRLCCRTNCKILRSRKLVFDIILPVMQSRYMQNYWACKFIFADLCIHQLICLIVDIYVSKICFYLHGVVVDIFCFVDILYFNMSVGLGPGLTSALKLRRDMTVRKLASYREGTSPRKYFSTYLLVLWFGLDRCLWEWSVNAVQGQEDGQLL